MRELRERGIDIHFVRINGAEVFMPDKSDEKNIKKINECIEKLIDEYLNICNVKNFPSRPTKLLVNKCGIEVIGNIVKLQEFIEKDLFAQIDYIKRAGSEEQRIIKPLRIYQDAGVWRLLAQVNESLKTMRLEKIKNVRSTEKLFTKINSEKIQEIFNYSWRSWISDEQYDICFNVKPELAKRIEPRVFAYTEKIEEHHDGSISVSVTVNSLDEIARWIAGIGEGITVIGPTELKNRVIEIGKGVLKNYHTMG